MSDERFVNRQVGPNLIVPGGCRIVEARGHYVMPGGIDPHTHLQTDFMSTSTADDFYSGSRAALAGGTTMFINHVLDSSGRGLVEAFDRVRKQAEDKACCDFGLHVAVTSLKDGGAFEREMETLVQERGVNSFKVFMAYKGQVTKLMLAAEILLTVTVPSSN